MAAVLGIRRLQATVLPGNAASLRLLAKLGFEREGLRRAYENWPGKGPVDLLMLARVLDGGQLGATGPDAEVSHV